MKTNNPFFDQFMETQTTVMNNWMDSAKKFQKSFAEGSLANDGQNLYKEWFEQQQAAFQNMGGNAAQANKPEEFFKNWYTQQMNYFKQMTDFNQSIYNSFANFGKPANDYVHNFNAMNGAWTSIYNSWMQSLNLSYDTFLKNFNNPLNKDVFKNLFESNQLYLKMQEIYQPMIKAMQNGDFSAETWKQFYQPESYKALTEQLFAGFFPQNNLKEFYDAASQQLQNFFVNQNNLGKEYMAQFEKMAAEYPQLFSGNFEKMKSAYSEVHAVFGKSFEPLLKLVTPGKEKEMMETTLQLMDHVAAYSIAQSELQSLMYATAQKALENQVKENAEKFAALKNGTAPSAQELYNEWVKKNEAVFAELFASDAFSKAKSETLRLGMEIKRRMEQQFEGVFEHYPVVFRSEMEELYKTIYDLKKTVKDLQAKLTLQGTPTGDATEDEKTVKPRKK